MHYTVLSIHGDIDIHCTTQSQEQFISSQGRCLPLSVRPRFQPALGGGHYLE